MPVQEPIQPTVRLSEADARLVQMYADSQGVTLEEACAQLVRQSIRNQFVIPRAPPKVLAFPRPAK